MDPSGVLLLVLLTSGILLLHVCGADFQRVTATYGETIVVPCNGGAPPPKDLMFIKWKYENDDGSSGDLLVKQARSEQETVQATDGFAQRVSVDQSLSLLVSRASLSDQRTFTCMVVSAGNILEYPVAVQVEKKPSSVQVIHKSAALQENQLSTVGTCIAAQSNPAVVLSWMKDGEPLVADGKAVSVYPSLKVDPATGLSTTSSTLQVAASREDAASIFSCVSTQLEIQQVIHLEPLPIHYPPEELVLVLPDEPLLEGSNVTLKCQSDGNPPPQSFYFHLKAETVLVEGSDSYTLSSISRDTDGEYGCSLAADPQMEARRSLAVSYLDLSLSPAGMVVKNVGDSLSVKMETNSSGDVSVRWTKDGVAVEKPDFSTLTYAHAGVYTCEASIPGLSRRHSFQLLLEGKPVITSLTKHRAGDRNQKVLTCEAEGVPEPSFHWSINGSHEESSSSSGRAVQTITLIPRHNLTVSCRVSNRLGHDVRSINVSSVFQEENEGRESSDDSQNQVQLTVGLVIGLLLAAVIGVLVYWLYRKNSRRGSWKTGEKEDGTSEESRRLGENHNSA